MLTHMAHQVLGIWISLVQTLRLEGVRACHRPEGALQPGHLWNRALGQENKAKPAQAEGYQRDQMTS